MNSMKLKTEKRRIVLFANHLPGLRVAKYLSSNENDEIVALYLSGAEAQTDDLIEKVCKLDKKAIFKGKQDYSNPIVLKELKRHNADTVICVYWPWILPKDVYTDCDVTINFHPALLPANKGWYPVHNLINGKQV